MKHKNICGIQVGSSYDPFPHPTITHGAYSAVPLDMDEELSTPQDGIDNHNCVSKYVSTNYDNKKIACRHTGERLFEFLLTVAHEYKIENKLGFVTTDGSRNAKRQIKMTAAKKELLLDIMYDPSISSANGSESTERIDSIKDDTLTVLNCITDTSAEDDDDYLYTLNHASCDPSMTTPSDRNGQVEEISTDHARTNHHDGCGHDVSSFITHCQLNGCSKMSYELPHPDVLSEMLETSDTVIPGTVTVASLATFSVRATWNQIICTDSVVLLSIAYS